MASTDVKRSARSQALAMKRVRFTNSISSNKAILLAIATEVDKVEARTLDWFSPQYTYHAYGTDETIDGYKGLTITIIYNGITFDALMNVKFDEKEYTAIDVVAKLTPSLPKEFHQDKEKFVDALRKAKASFTSPPGKRVESYRLREPADDTTTIIERHFQIYECKLEDNKDAQKLLANLQTLSLWFIEGADAVDVTDPRWIMYLAYERVENCCTFRPVGFVTVFKFFNPLGRKAAFYKPEQNETHRICQALIFPTYQRQGHAERLVHCIHARALANKHVYELTVEDPVPAFASVRDLVDLKNCVVKGFFALSPEESANAGGTGRGTEALTTADISAVQENLKVTHKQVQTCYEIRKFSFLNPEDEIQNKKFRLEVKKRLFRLHREDLDVMDSATRRKEFLDAAYRQLEEHYRRMASKIAHFKSN